MFNRRQKEYIGDVSAVFTTEAGMRVLAYLKQQYVTQPCIAETPHETYYNLGQQDLVQSILNIVNDPKGIDELIQNFNHSSEEY